MTDCATTTEPLTIYVKTLYGDLFPLTLPPAYGLDDIAHIAYMADPEQFPQPHTVFFPIHEDTPSLLHLSHEEMIGAVVNHGIMRKGIVEEKNGTIRHYFTLSLATDTQEHTLESMEDEEIDVNDEILRNTADVCVSRHVYTMEKYDCMSEKFTTKTRIMYSIIVSIHHNACSLNSEWSVDTIEKMMKNETMFSITLRTLAKGYCDFSFQIKPESLEFIRSLLPSDWGVIDRWK